MAVVWAKLGLVCKEKFIMLKKSRELWITVKETQSFHNSRICLFRSQFHGDFENPRYAEIPLACSIQTQYSFKADSYFCPKSDNKEAQRYGGQLVRSRELS